LRFVDRESKDPLARWSARSGPATDAAPYQPSEAPHRSRTGRRSASYPHGVGILAERRRKSHGERSRPQAAGCRDRLRCPEEARHRLRARERGPLSCFAGGALARRVDLRRIGSEDHEGRTLGARKNGDPSDVGDVHRLRQRRAAEFRGLLAVLSGSSTATYGCQAVVIASSGRVMRPATSVSARLKIL
jgi:hypothetical protein